MNLEPAPRLNKTPFLAVAAVCITVVVLIGLFAPNKFAPVPFLSAVGFLAISITAIMIPFLADHTAVSSDAVQAERLRAADQIQRLHAATESLTRAAAQIKAVEEAAHKSAHAAENLPYRMQEKLAEFNEALAEKEESDREALEQELAELRAANSDQLKAVADKIHKAATDWSALEVATRKQLAAAEDAATKVQSTAADAATKFETRIAAALATLDAKLAVLNQAAASAPPAAPVAAVRPSSEASAKDDARREEATPTDDNGHRPPLQQPEAAPAPVIESVTLSDAPAPAVEEPKPKKPRAPRKPKPEDILAAMSAPTTQAPEESGASSESSSQDSSSESTAAPAEASASSDGATRLLATAYIGIGNKLYIRGNGPGLSRDKGVPMQFVSIGKWGWATHDATAPIVCSLYKNDDTAALTGEVTLEPGKHVEMTALF